MATLKEMSALSVTFVPGEDDVEVVASTINLDGDNRIVLRPMRQAPITKGRPTDSGLEMLAHEATSSSGSASRVIGEILSAAASCWTIRQEGS